MKNFIFIIIVLCYVCLSQELQNQYNATIQEKPLIATNDRGDTTYARFIYHFEEIKDSRVYLIIPTKLLKPFNNDSAKSYIIKELKKYLINYEITKKEETVTGFDDLNSLTIN